MLPFFLLTSAAGGRGAAHVSPSHASRRPGEGCRPRGVRSLLWEIGRHRRGCDAPFVLAPDGLLTPIVLADQEQHISADVAYAVWSWRATGDERFLLRRARRSCWRRRASGRAVRRRETTACVTSAASSVPTNTTRASTTTPTPAAWRAGTWSAEPPSRGSWPSFWPERWRDLAQRLGLDADEPRQWEQIARELYTGFDPATGLIEQFRAISAWKTSTSRPSSRGRPRSTCCLAANGSKARASSSSPTSSCCFTCSGIDTRRR